MQTYRRSQCLRTEIIFEVSEGEVGTAATPLAHWDTASTRRGDSLEALRRNVKEAVDCYFDDTMPAAQADSVALRTGRGSGRVRFAS